MNGGLRSTSINEVLLNKRFPIQNHLKQNQKMTKYCEKPNLKFCKTCICEKDRHANNCQKHWIYQIYTAAPAAPDQLKALAVLQDITVRKFAVD